MALFQSMEKQGNFLFKYRGQFPILLFLLAIPFIYSTDYHSFTDKNYTFLATVGSTAPFIGLFGTVWGIMNSFQSIAISRNTSLAIVAPGIAEALFATALGLLAAIPAVVAFNKFSSDSRKYSQKLENFSKRFISIV